MEAVVAAGRSAWVRREEAVAIMEEAQAAVEQVEEAVQEEEATTAAAETATTMEEATDAEEVADAEATEEAMAVGGRREASSTCKSAGSSGGGGVQRWEGGVSHVEVLKSLARTPKGVTVLDVHGAAAEGVKFGACAARSISETHSPSHRDKWPNETVRSRA